MRFEEIELFLNIMFTLSRILICISVFCTLTVHAQLAVTVSSPKITEQKAIVSLAMTNNLAEPVRSARAICFLLDEQGKMIGQSSKWVRRIN